VEYLKPVFSEMLKSGFMHIGGFLPVGVAD
jgi:hypothetical protein